MLEAVNLRMTRWGRARRGTTTDLTRTLGTAHATNSLETVGTYSLQVRRRATVAWIQTHKTGGNYRSARSAFLCIGSPRFAQQRTGALLGLSGTPLAIDSQRLSRSERVVWHEVCRQDVAGPIRSAVGGRFTRQRLFRAVVRRKVQSQCRDRHCSRHVEDPHA